MKKKAVISTVASVALAGVLCVSFAACENGNDAERTKGEVIDKAESIEGEEVDKTTWTAAFQAENFENVKIEYECESKSISGEPGEASIKSEIVVADGKAYFKMHTEVSGVYIDEWGGETMDIEQYEERTANGDIVVYTKNDAGDWAADSNAEPVVYMKNDAGDWAEDGDTYPVALGWMNIYGQFIYRDWSYYGDFKYDADKKGYVEETNCIIEVYKIKDGKFAAILTESNDGKVGITYKDYSGVLFTYGGQSVALPV